MAIKGAEVAIKGAELKDGKLVGKVSEAMFTRQVIQLAQACGWKVAHFRPAQTGRGWRTAVSGDGKGFPDLCMVHGRRGMVVFAELKIPPNTTTPEQAGWILALRSARESVVIWTPADWPEIERVLAGDFKRTG